MPRRCAVSSPAATWVATRKCLVERQRATFEPLGQRLALQVLHHQKVGVLLPADVVERADIGMVECRDRFGFALEPLTYVWVGRDMRG